MGISSNTVLDISIAHHRPRARRFLQDAAASIPLHSAFVQEVLLPIFLLFIFPLIDYARQHHARGDVYCGGAFAVLTALSYGTAGEFHRVLSVCQRVVNDGKLATHRTGVLEAFAVVCITLTFTNFLVVALVPEDDLAAFALVALSFFLFCCVVGVCLLLVERRKLRKFLMDLAIGLK